MPYQKKHPKVALTKDSRQCRILWPDFPCDLLSPSMRSRAGFPQLPRVNSQSHSENVNHFALALALMLCRPTVTDRGNA